MMSSIDLFHTTKPRVTIAAMLDAKELARRLRVAMDTAKPPVSSAKLAEECDVTPQAIHGWRLNGRVHKKHIPKIAELTGRPPIYFLAKNPDSAAANAMELSDDEAAAVKALRGAMPGWRSYVLGLAHFDKKSQEVMLKTMRAPAMNESVERAYGTTGRHIVKDRK